MNKEDHKATGAQFRIVMMEVATAIAEALAKRRGEISAEDECDLLLFLAASHVYTIKEKFGVDWQIIEDNLQVMIKACKGGAVVAEMIAEPRGD